MNADNGNIDEMIKALNQMEKSARIEIMKYKIAIGKIKKAKLKLLNQKNDTKR